MPTNLTLLFSRQHIAITVDKVDAYRPRGMV